MGRKRVYVLGEPCPRCGTVLTDKNTYADRRGGWVICSRCSLEDARAVYRRKRAER